MPVDIRPVAPDVWVVDRPQTFYGLPVGSRMTVIRLAGDHCSAGRTARPA